MTTETKTNIQWQTVCSLNDLLPNLGVRALINGAQIAVFKVKDTLYAIDAIDPFTRAAVLARGIVGDLQGQLVVASPIYKQHYNLITGQCLEDENVKVNVYAVRAENGLVEIQA